MVNILDMKTKDKKELFTKSIDELEGLLKETRRALLTLRLEKSQNKLKNTRVIFLKRKDIARMLTALRQKEFANEKST